MNFFQQQAQARKQSRWLIAVFVLAVAAIVVAINGIVLLAILSSSWDPTVEGQTFAHAVRSNLPLMGGVAAASIAVIFIASLFKTASLKAGGGQVARQLGGTLVEPRSSDPLKRRLYNVVEEIALASGVPVPEVYVLDQESGINAFAAGFSTSDAAVAVTRGTLEKLSRSELQGVIAHEFSHILNGDMRINIRLMGALFGILLLALIGRRVLVHSHLAGRSSRDRNGAVVLLIAVGLMVVGYIGLFFGRWIKAAVSRQREYLADASAVQFTRDPDGIGGALKKIAVYSDASYLNADTEEVSHMLFGDGRRMRMFSTHPPLNDRIGRVDPNFQPDDLHRLAAEIQRDALRAKKQVEKEQAEPTGRKSGFDAGGLVDQIGQPDFQRMLMAAALAASIPDDIGRAVRSPEWAAEVLLFALLDADDDVRQQQLLSIAQGMGAESEERVRALYSANGPARPEQRMPLLELAFPLVRQRPPDFIASLMETLQKLIQADGRIDVFEYLLARSISQHLWEAYNPHQVRAAGRLRLPAVAQEAVTALAILARHGAADAGAAEGAFRAGLSELSGLEAEEFPLVDDWVEGLDTALSKLDRLRAEDKELLVRGLVAVAVHDEQLQAVELELLRAICDLLHVPLPLLSSAALRTSPQS